MRKERYHSLQYPVWAVLIAAASVWWWRRRPFRVTVEGGSMAPALEPGDLLVAVQRASMGQGDLIVADDPRAPGFELVKRVIGVPGDSVREVRLGAGEYWIEGDRAEASTDSRAFGSVRRELIKGVVRFRYWPPSRVGWL